MALSHKTHDQSLTHRFAPWRLLSLLSIASEMEAFREANSTRSFQMTRQNPSCDVVDHHWTVLRRAGAARSFQNNDCNADACAM